MMVRNAKDAFYQQREWLPLVVITPFYCLKFAFPCDQCYNQLLDYDAISRFKKRIKTHENELS